MKAYFGQEVYNLWNSLGVCKWG